MAVEKAIGRTPPELQELLEPPCPHPLIYLWRGFLEISSSRGSNGYGPSPISYTELDCWARLTRRKLTAFDVEVIMRLDSIYLSEQSRQAAAAEKKGNKHG